MSKRCLFHGERIYFEDVKKALRRARLIPRNLTPCLAMAVCSCRKKVPALPCSDNEMSNTLQYFRRNLETIILDNGLKSVIQRIVNSDEADLDKSYLKLLYLIQQTSKEDFTLLTNEQKLKTNDSQKIVKRKRRIKVTPQTAMYILKKRMAHMAVKNKFLIPMFAGSMKLLYLKTGTNFCSFSREHRCVVRLNNDVNTHNVEKKIAKTSVTVGCNDQKTFESVQQKLSAFALEIQRAQDVQWRKTLELRRHRKEIRKQYYLAWECEKYEDESGLDKLGIDCLDFKEINSYNCDRKRDNDTKSRGKTKRQPHLSLIGGHCLYCLKVYSRAADHALRDSCIHHPGYIRYTLCGWTWSCCDERGPEYPTHEDHAETGCTTTSHEWKTHKKASRKPEIWKHSQLIDFPLSKINSSHCVSATDALREVNSFYLENHR